MTEPPPDDDTISYSVDHWVEFTDTAINLTGIPDEQFRSVDDNGNPVVETESMDYPLIDFDDLPVGASDASGDSTLTVGQVPRPARTGRPARLSLLACPRNPFDARPSAL